jgi:acetyl esterase/lipase
MPADLLPVMPDEPPLPSSVSDEARAFLAAAAGRPAPPLPPLDDRAAWRRIVPLFDAGYEPIAQAMLAAAAATVETAELGGVTVHVATPHRFAAGSRARAHLSIHGGGWAFLGGTYARATGAADADLLGCVAYSVDYRRPPDHPYPAPLDDCLAVYRALLDRHDPQEIVVSGASAGGNLTAALALRVREEGLPLPAALGLLTPATDLTRQSDTLFSNRGLDVVLRESGPMGALYAAGHDPSDPYLSPVFADFTRGFPPSFLQSGTRDLLLSDTVRLHRALRRAGVVAELHVWEGMPHGGFGGATPEDRELRAELAAFFARFWK